MSEVHDEALTDDESNTPLDEEEEEALIPGQVTNRAELNEWEALNISSAYEWLSGRKSIPDILDVLFLEKLHRHMFDKTWTWAGRYRTTEKSVSPFHPSQLRAMMKELVENVRVQYQTSSKSAAELDEIALRFHHLLVQIHPWPNGNGRHARLATDLLLKQWGQAPFTWGGADLAKLGGAREAYINALRQADKGDFKPLRSFVRT